MHLQTVTFERVFSIRRFLQNDAWSTEFGFVEDGNTHYTTRVPSHPSFESADTVTSVMGTPERRTTMMGWLKHTHGEIVYLDMWNTWVGRISIADRIAFPVPRCARPTAATTSGYRRS